MRKSTLADREWDILTAALNLHGVYSVVPVGRPTEALPEDEDLFRRLAAATSVRLQEAIIPLLLTDPDLQDTARRAIGRLEGRTRFRAMRRYVAAAALQREWWTRLRLALGPKSRLEPAYLDELSLPSLDLDFGRTTLLALSNAEEQAEGYDAWAGYTSLMDHFLAEIDLTHSRRRRA